MDVEQLRERVDREYSGLGLPSWPNPNPDGPAEDAYSRVTDPARYRITHARAKAWATVLGDLPGVAAEPADHGTRVTPPTPGALPLLLVEHEVAGPAPDDPLAVLTVAVERPDAIVATYPDCGCDACDQGSADLLEAVDDAVAHVVGGPLVVLRGDGWDARWHPDGGAAQGVGVDFDHLMDLCRRLADGERVELPAGAEALVGRPWFA
ncbi:DUF6226 family protein [Actinokineospora guangxiensis]|uniref:DUF6226 family protein n=1 Tax=Actinokineospora guangxiensis TaxID=1490288 RepID=A0ABW0EKM3_9PSEU